MQQMQEVFNAWQAEMMGVTYPQPYDQPQNVPYAPQQWNPNPAPPPPSIPGFLSPQSPNTPASTLSNATTPAMSPNVAYAYMAPPQPGAVEMPGNTVPAAGTMLAAPAPAVSRASSTDVGWILEAALADANIM